MDLFIAFSIIRRRLPLFPIHKLILRAITSIANPIMQLIIIEIPSSDLLNFFGTPWFRYSIGLFR